MTTENVAILFTDVVGSTELSQRLSAEAADESRRQHFSVLRQAIAESGGTEVKNLGDGLMVVFSSASAALTCGVAMQQGVERANRGSEVSIGLRVGLSVGEASREKEDYFGDPVVEAARLCAACAGGQILATDMVRGMAGRRTRHECRSLGEMSLKGLRDPVETVDVLWQPVGGLATGAAIPLPRRLAARPSIGVVGRESELALLLDAAKRVAVGDGREVLLISGEAGLGKSTVVAEAARTAYDDGAIVLFGHCEEGLATPYQLFAEALGHYVTHGTEDNLVAHAAAHGSELARLVPAYASRIPDLPPTKATDAETERFLLFAAVVGMLTTASQDQPVVLILDDLQWADKASLLLLRHLAASDQAMRVLVLATYRDSELSQAGALRETLGVLHRHSGVSRVELAGLDDAGVVSFLEAAAGQTLDDAGVDLAHALYRETDGNPFFVSEVLRHLAETRAIHQDASGQWMAEVSLEEVALPNSVREVIGGRVVRLGTDAERALSVAAVIGRDFDLDVLARATEMTEDALLDILEAAATAALVRELAPGRYNFAHALIQHTLYEDLGLTRRAQVHRQVAEALEALCGEMPGPRVGELARHWVNATQPIDLTKAIRYLQQAGDAALSGLAPADALGYFAQALDLYPNATNADPVLPIDLAIGLGTAQRQTGDPAFRETLLDAGRRAADLDDTGRLVAAALANDRGFFNAIGVVDSARVEILELALARLPADHVDRALVLASLCAELTFGSPLERRLSLADDALALAEAVGDDTTIVRVLNHLVFPVLVPSTIERLLVHTADALTRAERVGDPVLLFWALLLRRLVALCAGDLNEVDRCDALTNSLSQELNQPTLQWLSTMSRGVRALLSGSEDAERLVNEAFQIGTDGGQPDAVTVFVGQLSSLRIQRGTLGEFAPVLEQAAADTPAVPTYRAVLAMAHAEADRFDEARLLLEDFAAADFSLPMDFVWLTGMFLYAEVATVTEDTTSAGPLYDLLSPYAGRVSTTGGSVDGPVSHVLGQLATVLGRYDEAEAHFAQSNAFSEEFEAMFCLARTNMSWGRMLAQRNGPGDLERSCDLLTQARGVAAAHGFATVERRAGEALARLNH